MAQFISGSSIAYGATLPEASFASDGTLFYLTSQFTSSNGTSYSPGLYIRRFISDISPGTIGDQVGFDWVAASSSGDFVSKLGDIMSGPLRVNAGVRSGQGSPVGDAETTVGYSFGDDGDTGTFATVAGGGYDGLSQDVSLYLNGVQRLRITSSNILVDNTHSVWHAGNDGAGSGLDADTLDGYQAADLISMMGSGGPVAINDGTTGILLANRGGTGTATLPNPGGIIFGSLDGLFYGSTLTGTVGQVLLSNGTGTPTWANTTTLTSGKALTLAQNGDPLAPVMTFDYAGQAGQPSWLWGTNNGTLQQVYNPANFSVASATNASNVPWGGVAGAPTALSQFTNDTGFVTNTSLGNYVLKSGDTMTGGLAVGPSGVGGVIVSVGIPGIGRSGLIQFMAANNIRQGYIGFSPTSAGTDDQGSIEYNAALHSFFGNISCAGSISANGDIIAYASDARLKKNVKVIPNALDKVKSLGGYEYDWDLEKTRRLGFQPTNPHEHGLLAQDVQKVMPDAVAKAPFNEDYLTVKYDRVVALLIAAVNEQQEQIAALRKALDEKTFGIRTYGL